MPSASRYTRGQVFSNKATNITRALGLSDRLVEEKVAKVSISSTNILNMFTTPVNVLAAPGAGKAIVVDSIIFKMVATATAYAAGGVVSFVYTGGSVATHASTLPASVITAGAGTTYTELGPAVAANGTTLTANVGVDITNATGAFTTGTGTAVAHIHYRIITLP